MLLVVESGGVVRCLYGEQIELRCLGALSLRRASHVEPDNSGVWWADLGPMCGPRLGPYAVRSQALDAERAWLEVHDLGRPGVTELP